MSIFDIFTTDAAEKAAAARKAGLEKGYSQASDLYGTGREAVQGQYTKALEPFAPLSQTATNAFQLYGDLTGAGGTAGQDRARALFQTDPGYEFARDEALQAVMRNQAGAGMLSSGNTLTALQDRASNLASQQYGNWADRLLKIGGTAPQIAAGQSGIYTGLGDRLLGSYGQQGNLAYQTQTGMGEADAQAALDANRASGQFWNTLLGGANLALKASGIGGFAPGGLGNFAMAPSPNGPGTFAPMAF